MIQNIRITTLVENTASGAGLLAEHGLSFWIEYGDKRILFDTGQSDILTKNAKVLGIDLAETDAIVLSHGHYDHTGGLSDVLEIAAKAKIYLHPGATEPKFSKNISGAKSIGMPDSAKGAIQGQHMIWTETPATIFPGISVTGQVNTSEFNCVYFIWRKCSARALLGKAFALRLPLSYQPIHQPFIPFLL